MSLITFYHYTDDAGKTAIEKEKMIRQSGGGKDANFGEGVYGTKLSPEEGKKKIAWNNWDGMIDPSSAMKRRAAWAIKIMIPKEEVKVAGGTKRNILIYSGDLDLDEYEWEAIKVQHT